MAVNAQATQNFVPIKEIRDGVIIMKDGSMRLVLMASSINISLKSYEEQQSIILQFQNFLNSLDFSVQIFVQSRKYDIRPYVALLEDRMKEQLNDLLKIQMREYINFVKNFTDATNIMTKNFFIVIPYSSNVLTKKGGPLDSILPKKEKGGDPIDEFETSRSQLEQRAYVVEQGLTRTGVRTIMLGTEEVIELFYRMFNPGEQEKPIQLS